MSIESAREFLRKVKEDEVFKNKIASCNSKDERVDFIKKQGFDFTEEEFSQVCKELTPEALDQAAGGKGCGFTHESETKCQTRCFDCNAL